MARARHAPPGWLLKWACGAGLALLPLGCGAGAAPSQTGVEQATPDSFSLPLDQAPEPARRQHLVRLGVERWHALGQRGAGVKVAILDSGFRGYRTFLGKALPQHVHVHSFRKDANLEARDSQHGILCGEVIHALAPQAELLFANWEPDGPETYLDAVRWARAQGAKVLSCSVIMPSWSDGEGGGWAHRQLGDLLGAGDRPQDLVCCASAGNTAQRHWCGIFRPDACGRHEWSAGRTRNLLVPWGREQVAVELYGRTQGAFEIEVFRADDGKRIGRDSLRTDATQQCGRAVVRFEPEAGASYEVSLRGPREAVDAGKFHLVALGGGLEVSNSGGSVPFPADGARVQAVGAVDVAGQRMSYSSCGQATRWPKPDFVAPVPFPSLCRERPFSGTSAAAPQLAALAALVWSSHPDWTANQVRDALRAAAHDLGPPGHDLETGHGLIRLP